tara:strand:+ start:366 stop:536 length:171 start_codon:yes stop_codon:yes gene_type:complete
MNPNFLNGLIMFIIVLALAALIFPFFIPASVIIKVTIFNLIQLITFVLAIVILRKK